MHPTAYSLGEYKAEEKHIGLFGILKANLGSIKKQREIKAAMLLEDHERTKRLIAESISEILRAGLTKKQLAVLEAIKEDHGELLNQLRVAEFGSNESGMHIMRMSHNCMLLNRSIGENEKNTR